MYSMALAPAPTLKGASTGASGTTASGTARGHVPFRTGTPTKVHPAAHQSAVIMTLWDSDLLVQRSVWLCPSRDCGLHACMASTGTATCEQLAAVLSAGVKVFNCVM